MTRGKGEIPTIANPYTAQRNQSELEPTEVGQRSVANYVRFTEAKFRSVANIYWNKRHGAMSLYYKLNIY